MNGGIDSPVSRSFQRRHLHVAAVISFPTWKSSLLLVCFLPSCVILRGKVCLTNLGASYLTAATNYDTEKANFSTKFRRYEYRASKSFEITFVYIYLFFFIFLNIARIARSILRILGYRYLGYFIDEISSLYFFIDTYLSRIYSLSQFLDFFFWTTT